MNQKGHKDSLITDLVLTRTPVFTLGARLADHWDELKKYIAFASSDLHDLIKDRSYDDYLQMPERIRLSVWKYFNRAKYRPTPYGPFASATFIGRQSGHQILPDEIGPENHSDFSLKLEKDVFPHEYIDWEILYGKEEAPDVSYAQSEFLWTNSTIYRNGDSWRCLTRDDAVFTLIALDYNLFLDDLLLYCIEPVRRQQVCSYLGHEYGISEAESAAFLIGLVGMQVLLTDRQSNITGEDYFSRVDWETAEFNDENSRKYMISERKAIEIAGNPDYSQLQELVSILCKAHSSEDAADLTAFRKRFLERFEYRNVPLMLALDPELGVGYGDMEDQEDQLPVTFPSQPASGRPLKANFSALYRYILDTMLAGEPVRLEQFDHPSSGSSDRYLPNSFNAMIRPLDGGISQLEFIGGCTGNSLIGRFSMAFNGLQTYGRTVAREEREANPGVLFADVAYLGDKKADNINRRAQLYDYELPILTWSTKGHAQALRLHDLYVTVQGTEVVLTSKTLGKRVIPRIVSAYNYQRTELSLFRFFADLQYQNLHTDLSLSLQSALPDLSRYPRVMYKNLIISPARWKVPEVFCRIAQKETDDMMLRFSDWLKASGIQGWVRQGFADQFLYFDLDNVLDRRFLLLSLQGSTDAYLEEFLMPAASRVTDQTGAGYAAEHLLVLRHKHQIYKAVQEELAFTFDRNHLVDGTLFMPGDKWIYAELYMHPSRCNFILQRLVAPLVKEWSDRLAMWFFVRYSHPEFHLRLRFSCKKQGDLPLLFAEINRIMRPLVQEGVLRDVQWKPYLPEIERYGADNLTHIGKCFSQSSRFVLSLLERSQDIDMLYLSVVRLFDAVFDELEWHGNRRLAFVETVGSNFVQEFNLDQTSFKAINKAAKTWSEIYRSRKASIAFLTRTARCFSRTVELYPEGQQEQILADLFHMHINRLFNASPRRHECLIYQYMLPILKTHLYMGRSGRGV